ncbi:DUF898 family protein [Flavobacterium sp. ABG]|uniref:DUF6693 family protein n=1 Tax=Flavobacterium sp. ABG TaxID=1423322 RepID=UPI0006494CB5|nr:DUF898 family protein [Flavobacterium sp. ABG]KLT68532.1 hypothetical protein AB674_17030 [Flavobacterium sp. ABG]
MKNYFDFTLTGKKLLPVWLLFYALFITPYVCLIFTLKNIQQGKMPNPYIFPLFLVLFLTAFALTFYIVKLIIGHFVFKGKNIVFEGSFGGFIAKILLGYLLSMITLGIYMPWFMRDMHSFFIDNSSYDSAPFKFKGTGGKLFKIFLLTLFLPMIVLSIIMVKFVLSYSGQQIPLFISYIQQVITWIILIPYMYCFYKWALDIDYKNYNISWETKFWDSCLQFAIQIFLTIITFGIYMPMAILKLYKYFAERTVAANGEVKRNFGFDNDDRKDFLFIWGQILLTIVTLGIYYPWHLCNILKRLTSKTYVE